jgi:hypothetical protein
MTDLELHDLFTKMGKVDLKTGCWNWTGGKNSYGYGYLYYKQISMRVARLSAYLYLNFDLKSENFICHKCNNKACFNPEHLYVGTNSTNQYDTVAAGNHHNAVKTHCPDGHEYTKENIIYRRGTRECRECGRIRMNAHHAKQVEKRMAENEKLMGPPVVKDGYTVRYRL